MGIHVLSECTILPKSLRVQQLSFLTLSFWIFMEASLHRHDWLNLWPFVIDSTSRLSPLPGWGGGGGWSGSGTESSNPLISRLILRCFQSHIINIKKDTFITLIALEIPGFLKLCARKGDEDQICILIINHSITVDLKKSSCELLLQIKNEIPKNVNLAR